MANYGWGYNPKPVKPTEATKQRVELAFRPLIEDLKKSLPPLPAEMQWNHPIDVYGKWSRNFYYIYEVLKCPPDGSVEQFDVGLARIGHFAPNKFNLAYFRHTGQWHVIFDELTLEECIQNIREMPYFQV